MNFVFTNSVVNDIGCKMTLNEAISELKNTDDVYIITREFCHMADSLVISDFILDVRNHHLMDTEYRKLIKIFAKKIDFNELIKCTKNTLGKYKKGLNYTIETAYIYEHLLPILEQEAELIHGSRYSALEHRLSSVLPPELTGHAYSMVDYKGKNRVKYNNSPKWSQSKRGGKSIQGRRTRLIRRGSK